MGIFDRIYYNEYVKPQASEPPVGNKCNFYQWDEPDFVLPDEFKLDQNSSLADAIKVFWSAGGLDFFNVMEAEYYADNWVDFIGNLYSQIENEEFTANGTAYKIPLPAKTKKRIG